MKTISFISIFLMCLGVLGGSVRAIENKNTYIFAASACPPWKSAQIEKHAEHISSACKNNAHLFVSTIKKAFNVPAENIITIVDEKAAYGGLKEAIKKLADTVPKDSRVIMYFNFHGLMFEIYIQKQAELQEVFVLWTEDKPFSVLTAIDTKQWVTANELRKMIDSVRADELIITVDACHSGGAVHDIIKNHDRGDNWKGSEALMMSSKADQYSYLNSDGRYGIFTYNLSKAIGNKPSDLQEAFEIASENTADHLKDKSNQARCAERLEKILHKKVRCAQTPVEHDPSGLLRSIKLGSN